MEKGIRVWDEEGDKTRTVERYAYNGQDIVLQTDRRGDVTHRYLHGPLVDQCLADESVFEDNNGNEAQNVLYPLSDNLGTVRDIVDLQGDTAVIVNHIVYDTFGNVISQTDDSFSTLYGYTGRERDPESDLYYYRARYYDPHLTTFISPDAISFASGDVNLYRYVHNSPTSFLDPNGTDIYFAYRPIGTEDKTIMGHEMANEVGVHGYLYITRGEGDQEQVYATYSWHPFEWAADLLDANTDREPRVWFNDPRDMTPPAIPPTGLTLKPNPNAVMQQTFLGEADPFTPILIPAAAEVKPYELIRVVDEPPGDYSAQEKLIAHIHAWVKEQGVGWDEGEEQGNTEQGIVSEHRDATEWAKRRYAVEGFNCCWWAKELLEESGMFDRLSEAERNEVLSTIHRLNAGAGTVYKLPSNDTLTAPIRAVRELPRKVEEAKWTFGGALRWFFEENCHVDIYPRW